ncbi:MAG: metallophosphoesterase [Bryobacteraceae bacterium]
MRKHWRRYVLIVLAVAFLAAAVDAYFIEPYRIEVTHSFLAAPILAPLRIAHLTYLHTRGLGRRERKLLTLLDQEKPDVILITGDSISGGSDELGIRPLLSRLRAPLGVWLVRGNWENEVKFRGERAFYSSLGVHFLLNEAHAIRPDVWVVGLDDLTGTPDFELADKAVPPGVYTIAMFHSPAYFDQIAGRVPLALSGHTHGGQVLLPPIPVFWLPRGSGRYLSGWYEEKGSKMYVSRGIGTSGLPIRFLCRPELAMITLVPEKVPEF